VGDVAIGFDYFCYFLFCFYSVVVEVVLAAATDFFSQRPPPIGEMPSKIILAVTLVPLTVPPTITVSPTLMFATVLVVGLVPAAPPTMTVAFEASTV
jgi:hypothetical protein